MLLHQKRKVPLIIIFCTATYISKSVDYASKV
jgi:hypothetical protein